MRIHQGCGQHQEVTSIENNTPPIGEPKATATPAADAAVMTSLILPETNMNIGNQGRNEPPRTWTSREASRPSGNQGSNTTSNVHRRSFFANRQARGDDQGLYLISAQTNARAREHTRVTLLIKNVPNPRKPFIMKPARMHLISEIPEPAAYCAIVRTR